MSETLELTAIQKMCLRYLEEKPQTKFTGSMAREMNVLGSYNLVRYGGNFQWEFTELGEEVLKTVQISHLPVQKRSEVGVNRF